MSVNEKIAMNENESERTQTSALGAIPRILIAFCWLVTLLATIAAVFVFVETLSLAKGAPQEAAGAAMAMTIAIIPYIFTRAIEGILMGKP